MAGTAVKIMVELLSIFALATAQINEGRFRESLPANSSPSAQSRREIRKKVIRGGRRDFQVHAAEIGQTDSGRKQNYGCPHHGISLWSR